VTRRWSNARSERPKPSAIERPPHLEKPEGRFRSFMRFARSLRGAATLALSPGQEESAVESSHRGAAEEAEQEGLGNIANWWRLAARLPPAPCSGACAVWWSRCSRRPSPARMAICDRWWASWPGSCAASRPDRPRLQIYRPSLLSLASGLARSPAPSLHEFGRGGGWLSRAGY